MTEQGNIFDTGVFNEVRPTYVGPPVEDIAVARDYLTQTARDNRTAAGLLDQAFASTISELQDDPEAVRMVVDHKDSFKNELSELANAKNMAYVGPTIQSYVNKFTGDPRIAGRRKTVSEFNGYKNAIRENQNIPNRDKKAFLESIKYNDLVEADDDNLLYSLRNFTMPYERVDVNSALLDAAKLKLQFPDATSWDDLSFTDVNGNRITNITSGDIAFVTNRSNQTREVKPGELLQLFRGVINNNDAIKGYLLQEQAVNDYYGGNTDNVINYLDNIYNDPDAVGQITDKAINDFANSLDYKQSVVSNQARQISTGGSGSGSGSGLPYPATEIYSGATKNNTINTSRDEIDASIGKADAILNNLFQGSPANVSPENTEAFVEAVRTEDFDKANELANIHGIDPIKASEYVSVANRALLDKQLALAKIHKTEQAVINQYPIEDTKLFNEAKELLSGTYIPNDIQGKVHLTDIDSYINEMQSIIDNNVALYNSTDQSEPLNSYLRETIPDYNKFNNGLNKLKQLHKDYTKKVDNQLEIEQDVSDQTIHNRVLSHDVSSNKEAVNSIKDILNTTFKLNNLALYDTDGLPIGDNKKESKLLSNKNRKFEVESVELSSKALPGKNPGSWLVTGKIKGDKPGDDEVKSYFIPLGKDQGGLEQQMLTERYITNNPEYEATVLVNEILANNIRGVPFEIPNEPDMKVTITDDKVFYSIGGQKEVDPDNFISELGGRIISKKARVAIGNEVYSNIENDLIESGLDLSDNPNEDLTENQKVALVAILEQLNENNKLSNDIQSNVSLARLILNSIK